MSAQDSKLFVISGPSGAGKGTLVTRVRERRSNLGLTVSATTRAPRKGEVDGVNYFFLTREEFDRRVANGEFVEWAEVHGNCYGTLVSEVTSKLASGSSLILEIDVQGALQVKERFPEAVLIFIKPPSLEVLRVAWSVAVPRRPRRSSCVWQTPPMNLPLPTATTTSW